MFFLFVVFLFVCLFVVFLFVCFFVCLCVCEFVTYVSLQNLFLACLFACQKCETHILWQFGAVTVHKTYKQSHGFPAFFFLLKRALTSSHGIQNFDSGTQIIHMWWISLQLLLQTYNFRVFARFCRVVYRGYG